MSRNEKKRKRDEEQDDASSVQPSKSQKIETAGVDNEVVSKKKASKQERKALSKQKKSERKSKRQIKAERDRPQQTIANNTSGAEDGLATGQDFIALTDDTKTKKGKKEKKPSKKSLQNVKGISPRMQRKRRQAAQQEAAAAEASGSADQEGGDTVQTTNTKAGAGADVQHKSRFIVFVGNLPYDATTEQIQTHFAKLQPASVRLQTDKKTGQSKGFAFLEFANYDRMKTCLQLYHHSIFDPHGPAEGETDERKGKSRGRKLNVELTAGGGGKSTDRKTKILEKNKKLGEERERTKIKLLKRKAESERARILKAEKEAKHGKKTGANAEPVELPGHMGDIHPSRVARVNG